jgi:acetyl-CoA C-acetyltransferase
MSLSKRVAIVGVGITKHGFFPEKSWEDLIVESCYEAFQDARMDPGEIETGWISTTFTEVIEQSNIGAVAADALGINPAGLAQIVAACAGGGVGMRAGLWAIASGLYRRVLVVGVEKVSDALSTPEVMTHDIDENLYGVHSLDDFALMQTRYQHKYGVNPEVFAEWPVQARWYGSRNPKAMDYKLGELSREKVLRSEWFTRPINVLSAAKACDGSSAVIMVPEEDARKYTDTPVFIEGISLMTGPNYQSARFGFPGYEGKDIAESVPTLHAAREAYQMAGIKPEDIDFAQVHDCFPINVALQLEGLGLFPFGKGGEAIAAGETSLEGRCPTCTDGGRHSLGHPTGTTGINMIVESVMQMRGAAGARQVKKADIAVNETTGASNATVVVTVLKRK